MASDLPALLFPHTAPRRGALGALLPWWAPLTLLEPPSLDRGPEKGGPLEAAGLLLRITAGAGADGSDDPKAKRLAGLLRQWESWARQGRDSGELEAVKAGVQPPPPEETVRGLMSEIKDFGRARKEAGPSHPAVEADLFLHLAHVQDTQAAEMEDILARVERGQRDLGRSMGLNGEDASPADYEQVFYQRLPPVDYSLGEDQHLMRRLEAWATLAAEAGVAGGTGGTLATTSLPAVQVLLERANRRFEVSTKDMRSPAGAAVPPVVIPQTPDPDSPRAQEAARLVLPDLSGLADQELAELSARLDPQGLKEVREGLAGLLGRLAAESWSSELREELGRGAKDIAERAGALLAGAQTPAPGRIGVSLLAFPGLSRAQVLELMRDHQPGDLPDLRAWPKEWPAGSCPLLAVW